MTRLRTAGRAATGRATTYTLDTPAIISKDDVFVEAHHITVDTTQGRAVITVTGTRPCDPANPAPVTVAWDLHGRSPELVDMPQAVRSIYLTHLDGPRLQLAGLHRDKPHRCPGCHTVISRADGPLGWVQRHIANYARCCNLALFRFAPDLKN